MEPFFLHLLPFKGDALRNTHTQKNIQWIYFGSISVEKQIKMRPLEKPTQGKKL